MSRPRSHVNVIERDPEGNVLYDSRVDGPRRVRRPVTASSASPWKPLHHPTQRTPTAEEQELKDDYIASGLDAFNKSGPTPDRRS
jgi:hypothetical protein